MTEDAARPGDTTSDGASLPDDPAARDDAAAEGAAAAREDIAGLAKPVPPWRARLSTHRWPIVAVVGFVVLVTVLAIIVAVGVTRIGASADASTRAATRVDAACLGLETRLNRLSPPGAATGADERATAIRYENVAIEPFLAELDRLPPKSRRYEPLRAEWQRLVDAREKFARDLDTQAQTGRPAFFVLTMDSAGRDRVKQMLRLAPDSCDGAVRRLAAPDL